MAQTELILALVSLIPGIVYAMVGRAVQRRNASGRNRLALMLFSVWWYMLAALTGAGALNTILYVAGFQDLTFQVTFTLLALFLLCIGLWGLLYYLLFLFTGRSGILIPLTVGYIGYFFALVYYIFKSTPDGVTLMNGSAQLHYANQITGPFATAILLLLLAPQIIGALCFFFLYFVATDREQKFRIAVVSWSIIVWFGIALIGSALPFGQSFAWQIISRFIGLAAATAILIAYQPPKGLKRWFAASVASTASSDEEGAPPTPRVASAASRRAARSNPAEMAS